MFFERAGSMSDERWVKTILNMMDLCGTSSLAYTQMKRLRRAYGCWDIHIQYMEGFPMRGKFKRELDTQIRLKEDDIWRQEMGMKPSLVRYRECKEHRGSVDVRYDDSRGSALLAMARGGILPTRSHRTNFENIDPTCRRCGMADEMLAHVIHECNDAYFTEEDLRRRLGFSGEKYPGLVAETKNLLQEWEKELRIR